MRLFAIFRVFATYRLDKLIKLPWFLFPIKLLIIISPFAYTNKAKLSRAEKIACSLEDLGVIFIKFGQILSTRRDLLPEDIGAELARLQDSCRPFDNLVAKEIIQNELKDDIYNIFTDFSDNPIAAASIAQVYTAKLKSSGENVVIKVVRKDIEKQIARDLKLLYKLANIANKHQVLKRLRPIELVKEFEMVIVNEPNMLYESANASLLRNNFKDSDLLYVPKVFDNLTTQKVMVMERIYGIPVNDITRLKRNKIDLKALSENGVKIFFTQVFKHNFFHADMHPGNIFVAKDGKYNGVDFGIMGSLSDEDRIATAKIFRAFFNANYKQLATIFIESGWIDEKTNKATLENSFRMVCSPMANKDLSEISFGEVLLNLFNEARKFDAYIQPQLLLLDKTLLNIEGLGRQLYPQLDLWQTAKPLLDEILDQEFSLASKAKNIKDNMPDILEDIYNLPNTIGNLVKENKKQNLINISIIKGLKKQTFLQNIIIITLIFLLAIK